MYYVKWAINDVCNIKCAYCLAENKQDNELSFQDKCRVMDKLHSLAVEKIDFFGKEPLFNDDIFKLIRYAHSKGYDFRYTFISNGRNLKKYTKEVIESNFDSFTISYEGGFGGRKFTFDFNDLKPFVKVGIPVEISVDVHRGNLNEIKRFLALFSYHGVSSVYLKPILPLGVLSSVTESQFSIDAKDYLLLIANVSHMVINNLSVFFAVPFEFASIFKEIQSIYTPPWLKVSADLKCYAGKDQMFISSDGIAYGCGNMFYNGVKSHSCNLLGTDNKNLEAILKTDGRRLCCIK